MPLKLQVMEGVGIPVEEQEMLTESPSRTVTVGPLMAVVYWHSLQIKDYIHVHAHTRNILPPV